MSFHGIIRDAEFGGDLFVGSPLCDARENLALAQRDGRPELETGKTIRETGREI